MRISSDTSSPDYRSDYMGATVYLNGELVERVMAADDVAGEVTVASLNEKGNMYAGSGGVIATHVLKGAVQIVKYGSWRCARDIGFDAWMRDRTERAHAEYMARHADGGIDYRKGVTLGVDAAPASTAFIGRMNGAPMKEVRNGVETAESKSIYRQWLKGSGYRPCAHEYELDPWCRSGVVNCMYCRSLPPDAAVSRKD